jgi:hypothetical protein
VKLFQRQEKGGVCICCFISFFSLVVEAWSKRKCFHCGGNKRRKQKVDAAENKREFFFLLDQRALIRVQKDFPLCSRLFTSQLLLSLSLLSPFFLLLPPANEPN